MDHTNALEVDVPSWLSSKFLANILSEGEMKDLSITHVDVKAAVPKGENYLSTLYRIVVECDSKEDENGGRKYFLILKTLPQGEFMRNLVSDSRGFEKETQMYGSTLPGMYSSIKAKIHPMSPSYIPTKMKNVIVMEDLQHLGYKMADRQTGLDLEHCEVTVKALARFHAASLALHKSDPACMDIFTEGIFRDTGKGRERAGKHFSNSMLGLALQIENWPGYEHYADRIRNLIPKAVGHMIKVLAPKKDSLNVLNHGDCWVNNIMFHYCPITGKIDDVKLLDFQLARFSSPALDLQYFVCTSTDDDVRFQQRERLLKEYHAEFRDTLGALDLDPDQFTLEQLKEEFEEKEMFGLLIVCSMLWVMLAGKDEVPDLSTLKEGDVNGIEIASMPIKKAISGRRYKDVIQMYLRHYDEKGLI